MALCEKVSRRLKAQGLAGATRDAQAQDRRLQAAHARALLAAPTQLAARIFAAGRELLAREADGTRFRLIGIGVSELSDAADADPADLLDRRTAEAEHAVDRLRAKFGRDAVVRGLAIEDD